MSTSIPLQFHPVYDWVKTETCGLVSWVKAAFVSTQNLKYLPFLIAYNRKHCLNCQRKLRRSLPCTPLKSQLAKSYLFQGWRILNFHSCDVEPWPFILPKYKGMKQFVFICKAALSQQQTPQFSCYGWITPNPQSISVGVFFYGGKMFTVRMPNSSKEVNWWVNQVCFLELD